MGFLQAVEVASPNNTYELFIKTEIKSGVAVPKGRVNLPREAKPKSEDNILVFAEGRQAEEAKKAGAHIVGGTELIDSVGYHSLYAESLDADRRYNTDCQWPRTGNDYLVRSSSHQSHYS